MLEGFLLWKTQLETINFILYQFFYHFISSTPGACVLSDVINICQIQFVFSLILWQCGNPVKKKVHFQYCIFLFSSVYDTVFAGDSCTSRWVEFGLSWVFSERILSSQKTAVCQIQNNLWRQRSRGRVLMTSLFLLGCLPSECWGDHGSQVSSSLM